MIDVAQVLAAMPRFESFGSVSRLHQLVESLADAPGFTVRLAGTSENGLPIHHVRYGSGSVRALFVWPVHANEPVGSLTVYSLLTLLKDGNRTLLDADVEWHIVPCIDPDGAVLNEGWTQQPFDHRTYSRNHHRQEPRDQVERSFPITYKRLTFDQPSNEATILRTLLGELRPDFFYSLHDMNAVAGGGYAGVTHDVDETYAREIYQLLRSNGIPIASTDDLGSPLDGDRAQFSGVVRETFIATKHYDYLERLTDVPEEGLHGGGAFSPEYLAEVSPGSQSFLFELPLATHPMAGSRVPMAGDLRRLMLQVDAGNKYLVTLILKEWERTKDDVDATSHLYRKTVNGIVDPRQNLAGGLPCWPLGTLTTWDILFSPAYDKPMTEDDVLKVYLTKFYVLCNAYEFVRLLKASPQTAAVRQAIERLDEAFDEAFAEIDAHVDFDKFEAIDCNALARVQLGGGLIALNAQLSHAQ